RRRAALGALSDALAADDRRPPGSAARGSPRSLRCFARGPGGGSTQAGGLPEGLPTPFLSLATAACLGTADQAAPAPPARPEAQRPARAGPSLARRIGRGAGPAAAGSGKQPQPAGPAERAAGPRAGRPPPVGRAGSRGARAALP